MSRNLLTATFDAATELKDAGPVTATGPANVDGAPRVIDIGKAFMQATLIVDFISMDLAGGDERYEVLLQGSTDALFASDVTNLARVRAGSALGEDGAGIGRQAIPFLNQSESGTPLPYLRMFTTVTGGAGGGTVNYRAFITKNPTNG